MPAKYTPAQRRAAFWSRVDKKGPVPAHRPELGPCWLWTSPPTADGYGQVNWGGRPEYAHRVSYRLLKGPIPPDRNYVDHICHNGDPECTSSPTCRHRRCVNPTHLEAITQPENNRRGNGYAGRHARATHCPQGHEYTLANTYTGRGHRECRSCNRDRARVRARKSA